MGKKEEVQRDRGISRYKHNKERVLGAEIQGKIVDKDIKGEESVSRYNGENNRYRDSDREEQDIGRGLPLLIGGVNSR